jgi:hypothetical protein
MNNDSDANLNGDADEPMQTTLGLCEVEDDSIPNESTTNAFLKLRFVAALEFVRIVEEQKLQMANVQERREDRIRYLEVKIALLEELANHLQAKLRSLSTNSDLGSA